MAWTDGLKRFMSPVSRKRRAILKGGGEIENLGDVMMRHVAEALISSLGFEIVHRVGHGEISADVIQSADSIDAIFVLGSIQYSDAWPQPTLLERLERSIRFHRHFRNAKVVFLPATWGAFERQHRNALATLVNGATVLVRDRFSAECINGLLDRQLADYCPDLAFLYPPATPEAARPWLERSLADPTKPLMGIIPSQRCVEPGITPLRRSEDYVDALARFRDYGVSRGFNVVGVSHMLNTDRDLVLMRDLGIPCFTASDATTIRSLIASLSVCICSRYHGLISCLSHGTPVIALGWHHKYRNLMNDLELGACHLSVADLPRDPVPLLDALLKSTPAMRQTITNNVVAAQQRIRAWTDAR